MPYCTQCGRYLSSGETCSCSTDRNGYNAPPQNNYYQGGMQQPQYGYQQYPQYGYPYPQYPQSPYQQQKKSHTGLILLLVFLGLFLLGAAMIIPAMMGTVKRSKESVIRSEANQISKAANTALVELDEEGINTRGLYIISSDPEDNVAVPFDSDTFYEHINKYFYGVSKYKYFVVIRNGTAEYCAVSTSWTNKNDYIGTWPAGNTPRYYDKDGGKGAETKKKVNLDDLYWHAYDRIFG